MDPQYAPCGQCDCKDGVSGIPGRWEIPGVVATSICPKRQAPADWGFWAGTFQHYRNGHLWRSGGVSDQPALYLAVMNLIDSWANKLHGKRDR